MRISELCKKKKPVYSFEIFPPKDDSPISVIYNTLEKLADLEPDYISVTYGAGGGGMKNKTALVAKDLKAKFNIEPLAHLTCINSTKADIIASVKELKDFGIDNILTLRGDRKEGLPEPHDFMHASDLAAFISASYDFDIGGACYPEGHFESDSLIRDVDNLKIKVDSGVTHLNSQLFYDNEAFMNFLTLARSKGIDVPIQAGIMPLVKKSQVERIITLSGTKIPDKYAKMLARFADKPDALMDAGIAYATEQIVELLGQGVDGIHLYVMNNSRVARRITENISSLIRQDNKG